MIRGELLVPLSTSYGGDIMGTVVTTPTGVDSANMPAADETEDGCSRKGQRTLLADCAEQDLAAH